MAVSKYLEQMHAFCMRVPICRRCGRILYVETDYVKRHLNLHLTADSVVEQIVANYQMSRT